MTRPHRGWLICLAGGLAIFCAMGMGANIFTLYQPYILAEHGFTNAQGSWITTVRSLFSLITTFSLGMVVERLGLRGTLSAGVVCCAFSRFLFGLATTFPMFCLGAVFAGMGYTMAGTIPLALLVSNWFRTRTGLALGLTTSCSGFATILLPPILMPMIQNHSLSTSFFFEAALSILLAIIVFVAIRDNPSDLGLNPYQVGSNNETSQQCVSSTTLSTALLVAVLVASGIHGIACGPGFSHLGVLYSTAGFSAQAITALMSILGVALIVAKLLLGQLNDFMGGLGATIFSAVVFLLGLSLCCLAPTKIFAVAAVGITLSCVGFCFSSVTTVTWAKDLSGSIPYATLLRWMTTSYMVGSLVSGPVPGMLADRFGDYVPAYFLFIITTLLATILILVVYLKLGVGKKQTISK